MNRAAALLLSTLVALLLALSPAFAADFVWTTEAVDATRFIEADSQVIEQIPAGERVEVIFRDGERLRVKMPASSKFGWIDAGKATDTEPGGAPIDEEPDDGRAVDPFPAAPE
jgi:hypothetical protein